MWWICAQSLTSKSEPIPKDFPLTEEWFLSPVSSALPVQMKMRVILLVRTGHFQSAVVLAPGAAEPG